MEITDVRVRKLTNTGKMRALVSVTLDDAFVVHDIKVIEGEKGLFIAMPSRKASDGIFRDIAHPINTETRNIMQKLILDSYIKSLDEPDDVVTSSKEAEKVEVLV
ncbi:stage V sporulation protein G [Lachnospiraceae bacterium KH1T2]|nr:stage V sporulation protein G [Lachnospiraceae bacterium KH1T2]